VPDRTSSVVAACPLAQAIKASDLADNSLGILHTRGPTVNMLADKYAPLISVLRGLIARDDTALNAAARRISSAGRISPRNDPPRPCYRNNPIRPVQHGFVMAAVVRRVLGSDPPRGRSPSPNAGPRLKIRCDVDTTCLRAAGLCTASSSRRKALFAHPFYLAIYESGGKSHSNAGRGNFFARTFPRPW
jgi:hypothetical protein